MHNVLEVLDSIGRNANLRYAQPLELLAALRKAHVGAHISTAMIEGNRTELESLLGATSNVCCAIHAPEDSEASIQ